jgi:lysyl-tRNA synthetase class 2
MAEWYRLGISFESMIQETLDFIELFVGHQKRSTITYREAFKKYASIDYVRATTRDLLNVLESHGITPYHGIEVEGKDAILNLIMGTIIEPHLGDDGLCALSHYPATQAALALTTMHEDERVAERFEVYFRGIELANGYHELGDSKEQHLRFVASNAKRVSHGKPPLPIDIFFLEALPKMPACCGVAVGFDRLMMLRHDSDIDDVLPFAWNRA